MFGMNRVFFLFTLLLLCLCTTASSSCGPRPLAGAEPCVSGKQVWLVAEGQSIQDAIDAAKAAGGGEVWVAQGVYKLNGGLSLKSDIALYGGFQGGETRCSERPAINVRVASPTTVLDAQGKTGIFISEGAIVVDGFKIENSNRGVASLPANPGALFLKNLLFQNNTKSSAVSGGPSAIVIESSRFENNASDLGIVYVSKSGSLTILNSQFVGNRSKLTSIIEASDLSTVKITNSLFEKNESDAHLVAAGKSSVVRIVNSTFYGNSFGRGSLILSSINNDRDLAVLNSVFWANSPRLNFTDLPAYARVAFSGLRATEVHPGAGNINQDPLFKDADGGDFSLLPGSPCLGTGGAGAPLTNIDGETRSDPPNMGAY